MRHRLFAQLAVAALVIAAAAGPAVAGNGAALVRYVPDNASKILVIDMAHARSGGAIDKLIAQVRAHSPRWNALAADGVGLDLAVDTLVFAVTPDVKDGTAHAIAIVDGMAGPILAHLKTPASKATDHAGIAIWSIEPAEEAAIIDRHLVITTAGDMAATIDRAHRKSRAQPSNVDTLRAILAATETAGADVAGGLIVSAPDRALEASELGAEPLWVAFSIAASAHASLEVRIAFGDDAAAATAAAVLEKTFVAPDAQLRLFLVGFGPEFADSLALETDHAQVRVSASMPTEQADRFVDVFGPRL